VSKEEASQHGDYEGKDEVKIKIGLEETDFAEEYGESAWYIDCYATKWPPTLHNDITSYAQGVGLKTTRATSSSIMEVVRTSSLVQW